MALTSKQENFAQLVASGKTYAESYREAYPTSKDWKDEAVWVQSSQLMSNSKVIVRVEELKRETVERNKVTLDEVLREMAEWLRFDPISIMDDDGCLKPLSQIDKKSRQCISDISIRETFATVDGEKIKTGEIKNIKFLDRKGTADMFMKTFGAYINVHVGVGKNALSEEQQGIIDSIEE